MFGTLLAATVPEDWPPPLNDEASQRFFLEQLHTHPDAIGWYLWYVILRDDLERRLIGNAGFKAEPQDGTVEIGYSIMPTFHRRGFASEAAGALVDWAFTNSRVHRVIAETFPSSHGSLGVMRKAGFHRCDGASEPGAVRFEKLRGDWSQA